MEEVWTSVTHHSVHPLFYDEIQLQLPVQTSSHLLKFTFVHVETKIKKKEKSQQPVQSVLGMAFIALRPGVLTGNDYLADGEHTLGKRRKRYNEIKT